MTTSFLQVQCRPTPVQWLEPGVPGQHELIGGEAGDEIIGGEGGEEIGAESNE